MNMTITSPQKAFEDFKNDVYLDKNNQFLIPVYEKLFQDFSRKLTITKAYKKKIGIISNYFEHIRELKQKHDISFDNSNIAKKRVVESFIKLIEPKKVKMAAKAFNEIIVFLAKNRTNINGLQIICWTLFNETSLEDIEENYIDNEEGIEEALLSFDFLSLFIESENFVEIAINDLLIDIEIKSPTRRKSILDKVIFEHIADEIKKIIPDFEHNPDEDKSYFQSENNWLIDENLTRKIDFPLPSENAKLIDMVCKISKAMFIGTHKEQKVRGGAQDNQAVDARTIFSYSEELLEKIKEDFNVEKIYLCVILQAKYDKIKSSHWDPIFSSVSAEDNENKYLLNGIQFIELIKSLD